MNGGSSSRFKPVEPGANKGGFRKIKRGEGRASVRGSNVSGTSDRTMKVMGWVLLGLVAMFPLCGFASLFFGSEDMIGFSFVSIIFPHIFIMMGEMVTHREIPTRGLSMKLLWGGVLLFILLGNMMN